MSDPGLFWQFIYAMSGLLLYGFGYYVGKTEALGERDE